MESHGGATGSDELLGTIDYVAPEQITGERVDGRADVYSLACVLFECLTGTVPYVRENQAAVLWAHLHDDVPRATAVNPSLPRTADAALTRGMAKSPEDRFSTALELVAGLQPSLEDATSVGSRPAETRPLSSTPPAEPPEVAAPAGRGFGKRALAVAAVVGVLLGGLAAAGVPFLLSDDDSATPPTATEEPPARETTTAPGPAPMNAFDRELMKHVPEELHAGCRHVDPLTIDFDSTVSCRPGGAVSSVTYSHARSGFHLYDYFLLGMTKAGLPVEDPPPLTGLCSAGDLPSLNNTVAGGLSGRVEVQEILGRDVRLGFVRCYDRGDRARIEWTTSEVGIYAAAAGEELAPLYEWWRRDAGPEP